MGGAGTLRPSERLSRSGRRPGSVSRRAAAAAYPYFDGVSPMVAFRWRGGADGALDRELKRLERQVRRARTTAEAASLYSRAGDLCVQEGDVDRGLRYYGKSINAYLEGDLFAAARAVCRKLLRVSPNAVRARSTLAWISIRDDLVSEAEQEVAGYVDAAIRAAQEPTAAVHLRLMADATPAPQLREEIAHHLMTLGDPEAANAVLARLFEEVQGKIEPLSYEEADRYWELALRTVIIRSDERDADLAP